MSAALKHDVHFGAVAIAKVMKCNRSFVPTRLPPQLLKHKGFQQLPQHGSVPVERIGVEPKQCTSYSGVSEMELGCFDKATQPVTVPRGERLQQKYAFEQRDVIADRRPAQLERACQIADVEKPRRLTGGKSEQPWKRIQRADTRQLPHIALHEGLDVVPVPRRSPAGCGPSQRSRVTTCGYSVDQASTQPFVGFRFEFGAEDAIQKVSFASGKFRRGEWV